MQTISERSPRTKSKQKYEIEVNNNFVEVTSDIFRSWTGKRKLNNKEFAGDVYYYLSEDKFQK